MSVIPEDAALDEADNLRLWMSADECKRSDVNHDIKSTLTDLLNCESIRNDNKMRFWVQTRLMDAELELKRQRRRRISTPNIFVTPSEEQPAIGALFALRALLLFLH